MFRKFNLQYLMALCFLFTASMSIARDFIIYSIVQDLPMGHENEKIKKNYYVNVGTGQGVKEGTVLDVFRTISQVDPYSTKKRYNHKVKIGELDIIHTEEDTAIGAFKSIRDTETDPLFEVKAFMIGDQVDVHVKK